MTDHKRFITVHQNEDFRSGRQTIIKDNETGVLYFMVNVIGQGAGVGLTPLLDSDGKIIVDK